MNGGLMGRLKLEALGKSLELVREQDGRFALHYVDQRLLPKRFERVSTREWRRVVDAVKTLAVRGAPAIGVAGAAALALWCQDGEGSIEDAAHEIASARPTAVNLSWAVKKAVEAVSGVDHVSRADCLFDLVKQMETEDELTNRAIGANGAELLEPGTRVLTHCNAGSLATVFYGTALGIVYAAFEQGKVERVFADETRPVDQGARLTAWELAQAGVPVTLICDDMAATVMAQGLVDAVVVGADRIARNGDVANKIGTYGLAVLAHEHGIPFYVAAPSSTLDAAISDGSHIVIEQRDSAEVAEPIKGVDVYNPAFDVTPAHYITRIITERGVFRPGELEFPSE